MKISIIGCGYVGITLATHFANAGHNIALFDSDPEKMKQLNQGDLPLFEKDLLPLYKKNIDCINAHSSIAELIDFCSQIFVAVGTPQKNDGSVDLSFIQNVFEQIAKHSKEDKIIVIKSTVPPGTTDKMQKYCDANSSYKLTVIFNPEFLRQGQAIYDFENPDRIIIGIPCEKLDSDQTLSANLEKTKKTLKEIYKKNLKGSESLIFMDTRSAELTKYAANAFLATKLSFINEISLLSKKIGADINLVKKGITSDHRISEHYFNHGIGYGGSCLPKDLNAVINIGQDNNLQMLIAKATQQVNKRQKEIFFDMIVQTMLNNPNRKSTTHSLADYTFCVWGLSFKAGTDDTRKSPALWLIENLIKQKAKAHVFDPIIKNFPVEDKNFIFFDDPLESLKNADALIICNNYSEFKSIDLKQVHKLMKQHFIFDSRSNLKKEEVTKEGFEYFCIGDF